MAEPHDANGVWEPLDEAPSEEIPVSPAKPSRKAPRWLVSGALALCGTLAQLFALRLFWTPSASQSLPEVVSLGRALASGAALSSEDFVPVALGESACARQFIPWEKAEALVGRKLRVPVEAHDALPRSALLSQNLEAAFPERIPLGKRLFVLEAPAGGLSGALKRGDRIDVVGNLELPGKGFVTKTLLSGAVVVALGAPGKPGDDALSLFLDPRDVEFLVHARRFGTLSVVLRNPGDGSAEANPEGMTETQFLNDKRIQDVYDGDLFQIQKGGERHE